MQSSVTFQISVVHAAAISTKLVSAAASDTVHVIN